MEKHAEDDHCQCCHCVCVCSVLSPCVFWWEMKEKVRYPARARTPGIYNTITEKECKRKGKRQQLERPREIKITKKSMKILLKFHLLLSADKERRGLKGPIFFP